MSFISTAGAAIVPILIVFLAAALLALAADPDRPAVVLRYEIVDQPEERRVNTRPVPRGGGLGDRAAFLLVALAFLVVNDAADTIAVPITFEPSAGRGPAARAVRPRRPSARSTTCSTCARDGSSSASWLLAAGRRRGRHHVDFIANPFGPGVIRFDGAVSGRRSRSSGSSG